MTNRISLLAAALAVGAFVSLPALAQNAPSVAPTVQSPAAQTSTSVKPQAATDAHADVKSDTHKDKLSKDKKPSEQVAAQPGTVKKTGDDAKTMPTKP